MIKLADYEDLKEILDIVKDVINIEDKKLVNLWDKSYPTEQVFLEDLRKNQLYVFKNEVVKGFFVISFEKEQFGDVSFSYDDNYVVVHRLCVSKKYQKNNIAYDIMKFVESFAKQHDISAIRLDTYSENPITNPFYKKLGYELKGTMNTRKGIYNVYERTF